MTGSTAATAAPAARRGAADVPRWLRRLTALGWRTLVIVAFAAIVVNVALALSTVTMALLVGAIVAGTWLPAASWLRGERGWTSGRAAAVTSVLALGTVLLVVLLVVLAFAPSVGDLIQAARAGVDEVIRRLTELGVPQTIIDYVQRLATGIEGWVNDTVRGLAGPVGTMVTILILGGFLTFYLLADGEAVWNRGMTEVGGWRATVLTTRAASAAREVGAYLRGLAMTAILSAVTQAIYLLLLGVPLVGPLAVLVFLGGFVPYLGAIFTTALVVLVTFAARGWVAAVALLILIAATTVIQRRFLASVIYRGTIRVHPALILVLVPAGAALFGLAGLFLAVPVVVTAMVMAPGIAEALGEQSFEAGSAGPVPVWLDRLAQWSWRGLIVVALLAVVAQLLVAPILTAPVVIALIVACAMKPAQDALMSRGLGPTAAALAVTVVSGVVVVAVAAATFLSVIRELPAILAEAAAGANNLDLGTAPGDLVGSIAPTLLGNAGSIASNVASISVALVSAALLTFFFLRDGAGWWSRVLGGMPASRREVLGPSGAKAARILNGSTLGTGLVSLVAGGLQFLLMTLLGLPLAFPVGVLTFFGGFIPYVGNFIATGIGFLIALAVGGPATVAVMAVFTVGINILIGNFVAPLVLGRTVSLHPAVVLLAAPAGAAIGGLVGMFLIVPIIAIVAATWRSLLRALEPDSDGEVGANEPARS